MCMTTIISTTDIRESRSAAILRSCGKCLKADVLTGTDFFEFRAQNADIADKIIFTGMIDEYFGYRLERLSIVQEI